MVSNQRNSISQGSPRVPAPGQKAKTRKRRGYSGHSQNIQNLTEAYPCPNSPHELHIAAPNSTQSKQ
jgi:hypothetical protein